jgi:hypothetical protein
MFSSRSRPILLLACDRRPRGAAAMQTRPRHSIQANRLLDRWLRPHAAPMRLQQAGLDQALEVLGLAAAEHVPIRRLDGLAFVVQQEIRRDESQPARSSRRTNRKPGATGYWPCPAAGVPGAARRRPAPRWPTCSRHPTSLGHHLAVRADNLGHRAAGISGESGCCRCSRSWATPRRPCSRPPAPGGRVP